MKFCWTRASLLSVRCPIDGVKEERSTRGRCAQTVAQAQRKRLFEYFDSTGELCGRGEALSSPVVPLTFVQPVPQFHTGQGPWRRVEGLAAERNTAYVRRLSHRTRLLLGGILRLTLHSCWLTEAVLHRQVHDMTPGMASRTPRRMPIVLFKGGNPRGRARVAATARLPNRHRLLPRRSLYGHIHARLRG
jgi:hypothetical protein